MRAQGRYTEEEDASAAAPGAGQPSRVADGPWRDVHGDVVAQTVFVLVYEVSNSTSWRPVQLYDIQLYCTTVHVLQMHEILQYIS